MNYITGQQKRLKGLFLIKIIIILLNILNIILLTKKSLLCDEKIEKKLLLYIYIYRYIIVSIVVQASNPLKWLIFFVKYNFWGAKYNFWGVNITLWVCKYNLMGAFIYNLKI